MFRNNPKPVLCVGDEVIVRDLRDNSQMARAQVEKGWLGIGKRLTCISGICLDRELLHGFVLHNDTSVFINNSEFLTVTFNRSLKAKFSRKPLKDKI